MSLFNGKIENGKAPLNDRFENGKTPLNEKNLNEILDVCDALDVKINGLSVGVSGIKGNAESTYRTGNVNLTPTNIGAATTAQGAKADTALQVVPVATADLLGGVKIGAGIKVTADGTISVDESKNEGGNTGDTDDSGDSGDIFFDAIIKTQTEFEALYSSPTWLDATSVAFVGDGGTLEFTRSNGQGLKIPQNVKRIYGLNNAKIRIDNFAYNSKTNCGGMWYETLPSTTDYSIENITLTSSGGSAFYSCTYLTNCIGIVEGSSFNNRGFRNCTNLTNCTGIGKGTSNNVVICGHGFFECIGLTNCVGSGYGGGYGYGFHTCKQLTGCSGTGFGKMSGFGFISCDILINCVATGISENGFLGIGFYDTSYASYCRSGEIPSSSAIWGGTNTYRDDNSCELD